MEKTSQCIFLLILVINCTLVLSYEYYEDHPEFENLKQQFLKNSKKTDDNEPISDEEIKQNLTQLKQSYNKVENWPTALKTLGAVSAVTFDVYKNVVVFHRGDRVWGSSTFDQTNVFIQKELGPIKENTIITFDRETGSLRTEWGENLFYLPHGLHINGDYYYVTDVALHQVFRFNVKKSTKKPELILGEKFNPGTGSKFCKPTAVVSLENGDFFVADGYCNSRIIKFNFKGEKLMQWGKGSFAGSAMSHILTPPGSFAIPHAMTLVHTDEKQWLCVADRENGRIQCFNCDDGKFVKQYHSPIIGDRLFSVDYANGSLFVVNGPDNRYVEVKGFTFDLENATVTSKFGSFLDPHDIAVTQDAREVYVADLSPDKQGHRLYKYIANGMKPERTSGDFSSYPQPNTKSNRGDMALLVGTLVFFLTLFIIGIGVLVSRNRRRGHKLFLKPWDKTSKNIFYDYNQFEKIPQNDDDFETENQNAVA